MSVVGLLVLLSGVFYFTGSTVGGRVSRFEDRRPYNEVKRNAHRTFPMAASLGIGGLALMILGSRLRSKEESDSA